MHDLDCPQDHSVWLRFAPPVESSLGNYVKELASARQSPAFVPHITLLGDLKGPPAATLNQCQRVIATLAPVTATFTALERGDAFFMSLYFAVSLPAHVVKLRRDISAGLQVRPPRFDPHVSLAYGEDSGSLTQEVEAALRSQFENLRAPIAALSIVSSSRSIPIAEWCSLVDLPVARTRSG